MNTSLDGFVGRGSLLKRLIEIREVKTSSAQILCIEGIGGVGKTTLLSELSNIYNSTSKICVKYDFDEYYLHRSEDIRFIIAERLDKRAFKDYFIMYEAFDESVKAGAREEEYIYKQHRLLAKKWRDCFAKLNSDECYVLIFDTVEILSKKQIDHYIKYFLSFLPKNLLLIFSGRNDKNKIDYLMQSYISHNNDVRKLNFDILEGVKLEGFDGTEYDELIKIKLGRKLRESLPDIDNYDIFDYKKAIFDVSSGLPILLDLSIEIILGKKALRKSFVSESVILSKSSEPFADKLNSFKKVLISHYLGQYSSKLKTLILILSHAWPLDASSAFELLEVDSKERIIDLITSIRGASYIKEVNNPLSIDNDSTNCGLLKLHDVMREMIHDYGWHWEDPDKSLRVSISHKFLDIANGILEKAKNYKEINSRSFKDTTLQLYLERIEIQQKRHTCIISIGEGLLAFNSSNYFRSRINPLYTEELINQFDEVLNNYHEISFTSLLTDEVIKYDAANFLKNKFEYFLGRGNSRLQECKAIEADINRYISDATIHASVKDNLKETLIGAIIQSGDLPLALEHISELEESLAASSAYKLSFELLKTKGWVFRLMGNIEAADRTYRQANRLFFDLDDQGLEVIDKSELAELLQTWSYVLSLKRDQEKADAFAAKAINLFNECKEYNRVGYVESVLGRIRIEFNNPISALYHFKRALDLVGADESVWRGKILLGMCHAYYLRNLLFEKYSDDWGELEKCLDQASRLISNVEKSELFFMQGMYEYKKRNFGAAEEKLLSARDFSFKQRSSYFLIHSIIGEMRIRVWRFIDKDEGIGEGIFNLYLSTLKDLKVNFPEIQSEVLSLAIYNRTLGDFKFLNGDLNGAYDLYVESLPIIALNGRFNPNNVQGQLVRMEKMFQDYALNLIAGDTVSRDHNGYDEYRIRRVYKLAKKLGRFWRGNEVLEIHTDGIIIIRSWYSDDLSTFNKLDVS